MTTIDIAGIKKKKLDYANIEHGEFLTLEEYMTLTKKFVKRYAGYARTSILASDDAITNIATSIMMADWRWKDDYHTENGTEKLQRQNYRLQCAKYAIYEYIKRRSKNKLNVSLVNKEDETIEIFTVDNQQIGRKEKEELKEELTLCINNANLKQLEDVCMRAYFYHGMSYQDIGMKLSLSKERIRQIVKEAVSKIGEIYEKRLN